jgi:hypothetical protein
VGSSFYGDPAELDRLAGQLRQHAAEVRRRATDHVRQAQAARWVSAAAQAYRNRVAEDRSAAGRAAVELERAGNLLHAHADEVRARLALIAMFEREATAWFAHRATSLMDSAENVVDPAGRFVTKLLHDAPWSTWPIGPHNLPPSGDRRWLEVGGFLRGQGVL